MSVTSMTAASAPTLPTRRGSASASPLQQAARFLRTPKAWLLLLFVPLLLLGAHAEGWQTTLPHVAFAIAGACLTEVVALRLRHARWRSPTSALLSGLIVAFVLGPETPPMVTFVVGVLSTTSKYLFATRRGHIFNPAALALWVSVLLAATDQSWWGALPDLAWPWLLIPLIGGVVIADRLDKFPLVLAFLGVYFGLFTVIAIGDPARVSEMFRAPFVQAALFLAFFMLTDPPTSPARLGDQVWIGALVAVVSVLAQLLGAGQSYLLIGLLAGNLALEIRRGLSAIVSRPRPATRGATG